MSSLLISLHLLVVDSFGASSTASVHFSADATITSCIFPRAASPNVFALCSLSASARACVSACAVPPFAAIQPPPSSELPPAPFPPSAASPPPPVSARLPVPSPGLPSRPPSTAPFPRRPSLPPLWPRASNSSPRFSSARASPLAASMLSPTPPSCLPDPPVPPLTARYSLPGPARRATRHRQKTQAFTSACKPEGCRLQRRGEKRNVTRADKRGASQRRGSAYCNTQHMGGWVFEPKLRLQPEPVADVQGFCFASARCVF